MSLIFTIFTETLIGLGAVSGLFLLILYILDRRKKRLTCFILPPVSFTDIPEHLTKKIKIFYNDQPVDDLSRITVMIRNTGNVEIPKEDFDGPIIFQFDEQTKIIECNVVSSTPEDVRVNLEPRGNNQIKCNIGLLNKGDEITLQFICSCKRSTVPHVHGRVKGISKIEVCLISIEDFLVAASKMSMQFRGYIYVFIMMMLITVVTLFVADIISIWKGLPMVALWNIRDSVLYYGGMICGVCVVLLFMKIYIKTLLSPELAVAYLLRRRK